MEETNETHNSFNHRRFAARAKINSEPGGARLCIVNGKVLVRTYPGKVQWGIVIKVDPRVDVYALAAWMAAISQN